MCCLRSDHPAPGAQPCCPSGPGADALLTLLLLGDSFFLPGNPPVQTKKALKQRFLKLLPCCRPKSIPSLSESKCFFLPLCVFVPGGAAACSPPRPCLREGDASTSPLPWLSGSALPWRGPIPWALHPPLSLPAHRLVFSLFISLEQLPRDAQQQEPLGSCLRVAGPSRHWFKGWGFVSLSSGSVWRWRCDGRIKEAEQGVSAESPNPLYCLCLVSPSPWSGSLPAPQCKPIPPGKR